MVNFSKAKTKLNIFLNQAGEMAQWVKGSLCQQEDLSSDPLTKNAGSWAAHLCHQHRGRTLRALWPISLA